MPESHAEMFRLSFFLLPKHLRERGKNPAPDLRDETEKRNPAKPGGNLRPFLKLSIVSLPLKSLNYTSGSYRAYVLLSLIPAYHNQAFPPK